MGKVASDKCHKWVFKEPTECEPNISNYWQSSFDAVCSKIHTSIIFFFFPYLEVCFFSKKKKKKEEEEEICDFYFSSMYMY